MVYERLVGQLLVHAFEETSLMLELGENLSLLLVGIYESVQSDAHLYGTYYK